MSKGNGAQLVRQAGNVQRGEAFWRAALCRQHASGLAQRAFCGREGLAVSTFSWWSRRIASAQAPAGAVQFVEVTPTARRETGARIGSEVETVERAVHIRLDLGGGIVLEIVRG
jgi:hypothetical protein